MANWNTRKQRILDQIIRHFKGDSTLPSHDDFGWITPRGRYLEWNGHLNTFMFISQLLVKHGITDWRLTEDEINEVCRSGNEEIYLVQLMDKGRMIRFHIEKDFSVDITIADNQRLTEYQKQSIIELFDRANSNCFIDILNHVGDIALALTLNPEDRRFKFELRSLLEKYLN